MRLAALISLALLTLAPARAEAQGSPPVAPNALYLELGGSALIYSLNYERMLSSTVGLRLGGGYMSVTGEDDYGDNLSVALLMIPVTVSYLLGEGAHRLELGGGAVFAWASASTDTDFASGSGVAATGIVGYRYSAPGGGFLFRAGFTPLMGGGGFLPWFGASFGFTY
jgi:hypothetical protein